MKNEVTVLFQFEVKVQADKNLSALQRADRMTTAVLPRLAEFVAVTLPKDFPSLANNVQLKTAKVI